jgi:hypothetical protein
MRRSLIIGAAAAWLAGCGGGSAGAQGGRGGSGGKAAQGGAGGGVFTDGGVPACALASPAGGEIGPDAGHGFLCNTIPNPGTLVVAICGVENDGGVALDGGTVERPHGGVLRDGDYALVRWQILLDSDECGIPVYTEMSSGLRLFDGGTVVQEADVSNEALNLMNFTYNSVNADVSASGDVLTFTLGDCGGLPFGGAHAMTYTAAGDDLTLFQNTGNVAGAGQLLDVYTYRRTCTRP